MNWKPNTFWGWTGLAVLVFAIIFHRALSWFGLALAVAAFWWLYFVKDQHNLSLS